MEDTMLRKCCRIIVILGLVLNFIILGMGCNTQDKIETEQKQFDSFLNDIFIQEVQTDSLSLNYSLANPEHFGLQTTNATLGEYGIEQMNKNLFLSENYLKRLLSFRYQLLSSKQKLTYDILREYYTLDLNFGDFLYYNECLGPTTGIQAQLPILLAEYSFYDKKDIEEYLRLLPCVYDYFEDIAEYERQKAEHGLFMNDRVASRIIDQCKAFISDQRVTFQLNILTRK